MSNTVTSAEKAVVHLIRRIQRDPRLAYHFDPITESFALLTAAYAEHAGIDVATFRDEYAKGLRYEAPPGRRA